MSGTAENNNIISKFAYLEERSDYLSKKAIPK